MLYLFKGLNTIRQNTRVYFFIFIVPTPPCTLTAVIVGGFREEVALVVALKRVWISPDREGLGMEGSSVRKAWGQEEVWSCLGNGEPGTS